MFASRRYQGMRQQPVFYYPMLKKKPERKPPKLSHFITHPNWTDPNRPFPLRSCLKHSDCAHLTPLNPDPKPFSFDDAPPATPFTPNFKIPPQTPPPRRVRFDLPDSPWIIYDHLGRMPRLERSSHLPKGAPTRLYKRMRNTPDGEVEVAYDAYAFPRGSQPPPYLHNPPKADGAQRDQDRGQSAAQLNPRPKQLHEWTWWDHKKVMLESEWERIKISLARMSLLDWLTLIIRMIIFTIVFASTIVRITSPFIRRHWRAVFVFMSSLWVFHVFHRDVSLQDMEMEIAPALFAPLAEDIRYLHRLPPEAVSESYFEYLRRIWGQ